jgi:hypothetical protein
VLGIEESQFRICLFWLAGRGLGSVRLMGGEVVRGFLKKGFDKLRFWLLGLGLNKENSTSCAIIRIVAQLFLKLRKK